MDISVSKICNEQNSYQKQHVGNFFNLTDLIEEINLHKNKQDIKILLDASHGLSDALGTLNVLLFIAVIQKQLAPNQIYFYKQQYKNLHEFVNFSEIHLLQSLPTDESMFDIIIEGGYYLGLFWNHPAHFRNYISYNDHLKKEAVNHARQYGVHFRFKRQELAEKRTSTLQIDPETEFSNYMNQFLKVFRSDSNYFFCSDSTVVNHHIVKFFNIHTIPKNQNQWNYKVNDPSIKRRKDVRGTRRSGRNDASAAMLDLAILSQCQSIYMFPNTGFPIAATLLSDKFIPLDQNIRTDCWPQSDITDICYNLGYLLNLETV